MYFICVMFIRWFINFIAHAECGMPPAPVFGTVQHAKALSGRRMLTIVEATSEAMDELLEYDEEAMAWNKCMTPYSVASLFSWSITFVFFAYAGWRRIQIRKKFQIPGDDTLDYASWIFCAPCALCQETRTLAHNNVDNGAWHGPLQESYPITAAYNPYAQGPVRLGSPLAGSGYAGGPFAGGPVMGAPLHPMSLPGGMPPPPPGSLPPIYTYAPPPPQLELQSYTNGRQA